MALAALLLFNIFLPLVDLGIELVFVLFKVGRIGDRTMSSGTSEVVEAVVWSNSPEPDPDAMTLKQILYLYNTE